MCQEAKNFLSHFQEEVLAFEGRVLILGHSKLAWKICQGYIPAVVGKETEMPSLIGKKIWNNFVSSDETRFA